MKYNFGNRSEFAVSFELNSNYGGSWLFGKFCYWISDIQIGDYELGTSLRDILMFLRQIVDDNGKRKKTEFSNLSGENLYKRVDNALYGIGSEYTKISEQECWACFQISPAVDVFDQWKVYLIEDEMSQRILYSDPHGSISEIYLALNTFEKTILDVYNKLYEIYEMTNAQVSRAG
jgi:Immunity protein 42